MRSEGRPADLVRLKSIARLLTKIWKKLQLKKKQQHVRKNGLQEPIRSEALGAKCHNKEMQKLASALFVLSYSPINRYNSVFQEKNEHFR